MRIATSRREVVFGAAKIADPFLPRRRHELDRTLSGQTSPVDLTGERQHDRETSPVVVDSRANQPIAVATNREIRLPRKHRVEMSANDDRLELMPRRAMAPANHVTDAVRVNVRQSAITEPPSDPPATLVFFARRRGNLRNGDLRAQDRVVVRSQTRVRGSKRPMRRDGVGRKRRANGHRYQLLPVRAPTQVVDSEMTRAESGNGEAGDSRRLGRNVYSLSAVSFFTDVSSEMIYPLLPVFLTTTLGASAGFVGTIEGAAESVAAFLKLGSGWWSDRVRRRKPLVVAGYAIASVVRPLVAIARSAGDVLLIRVADRVGKGIRNAPRDALIADSVHESVRGRAFGFRNAADNAGALVGPLIAFALLSMFDFSLRTVFWLSAIPGAVAVVIAIVGVRESARHEWTDEDTTLHAGMGRRFWVFLVAVFIFTLGNSSDAFLLLRATELGVPIALAPVLWAVLNFVKSAFNISGGSLSDRVGRTPTVVAGWIVYAIVYFSFAHASQAWHAWALFAAYGLYFALSEGPQLALIADVAPPRRRGAAYGWYHLAIGIGAFPASLMFGVLWDRFGSTTAFVVGASLAMMASLTLSITARSQGRTSR
jgi:MFS family permease